MKFEPIYYKDKLKIINPEGYAGILTLWSKPEKIYEKLQKYPLLFKSDSPLVTISSFYGNGLPQMLANLAYNPQITTIAITGEDNSIVKSSSYLLNFLKKGVFNERSIGGVKLSTIKGTNFPLDSQLKPNLYNNLIVKRFGDLDDLVNFIINSKDSNYNKDRIKIELVEPKLEDQYPSDKTFHNIKEKTPIDAWMEVLFTINKFGEDIELKKGKRRTIYNLDVNIENPSFESDKKLISFGLNPDELKAYQKSILDDKLPPDKDYTYGNRIVAHWGACSLDKIVEMFIKDPLNRHCFVSLWDTTQDLIKGESSPCLTDIYFVNFNNKLMMTSSFRTHNATSAWIINLYGLIAIQGYVSEKLKEKGMELEPGQINIRSRCISIDPQDPKTTEVLNLVDKYRRKKIDINDSRGYFTIDTKDKNIVVKHYGPDNSLLNTISAKGAERIKSYLRRSNAVINPDHAICIGMELAKAEAKLNKK